MKEKWKPIKGYENYLVSDKGRIRSAKGIKLLGRHNKGYLKTDLYKNGRHKKFFVHRLVALHFVKNKNVKINWQVNHKNFDKMDNRAENLEWTSNQSNRSHAVKHGKYAFGERVGTAKLKSYQVTEIRFKYLKGITINKLANRYSVSKANINCIVNFKTWRNQNEKLRRTSK